MTTPFFIREFRRRRRLRNPRRYDYGAHLFIEIMGYGWLADHGFYREYGIGRMHVDFAQPEWGLVIEADGSRYHMDVVTDQRRDEALNRRGWDVLRFRYNDLRNHPDQVRSRVAAQAVGRPHRRRLLSRA